MKNVPKYEFFFQFGWAWRKVAYPPLFLTQIIGSLRDVRAMNSFAYRSILSFSISSAAILYEKLRYIFCVELHLISWYLITSVQCFH